jgi:hypothetical protein
MPLSATYHDLASVAAKTLTAPPRKRRSQPDIQEASRATGIHVPVDFIRDFVEQ